MRGLFIETHAELYARKPKWRDMDQQTGAGGAGDCPGSFYVEDIATPVWAARCDRCGDEFGIVKRDQEAYLEAAVRFGS